VLLTRGDSLFGTGDLVSARLFYERAAGAGSGEAALRLGESYDPHFLEKTHLRGHGDVAAAIFGTSVHTSSASAKPASCSAAYVPIRS